MNIFALHPNPRKAARWHADRHVVKMILESCQLLYTAHWLAKYGPCTAAELRAKPAPLALRSAPPPKGGSSGGYRPTHTRHPCALWTARSLENYKWLAALAAELVREYDYRYRSGGTKTKKPPHACAVHVKWLTENPPPLASVGRTPFALAIPKERAPPTADPYRAYRYYYNTDKREKGILTYTRRHVPHWVVAEDPEESD